MVPLAASAADEDTPPATPEAVKAALVEKFTRFTTWPSERPEGEPFVLCRIGSDAMAPWFDSLARERTIQGRRVEVRSLADPADSTGCQLLWIAADQAKALDSILASTRHRPVLTVGDTEGYAKQGVHIVILRSERKLVFDVNQGEARRSGLSLSSQLLRHARNVIR